MFTSIAFGSCVLLAYPISGGCLNPAIGFGINLVNVIAKGEGSAISSVWMYVAMPFLGGILGVIFFEKVYKNIQIFNETEVSVIEEFYQKKSKEIFDKRDYN